MVLAGPGTGKTELLSVRAANILRTAGVEPRNILCLTFTDNAARNMRERLVSIIGQPGYHVNIHTFHSFGADVIGQYGDFFTNRQLLQQVDELGRYELMREVFEQLPHDSPLSAKVGEDFVFLKDTLQLIGWLKQNAITADELRVILSNNSAVIDNLNSKISKLFQDTPSPKLLHEYQALHDDAMKLTNDQLPFGFPEYAAVFCGELQAAIDETPTDGRYAKPITAWRSRWCEKSDKNQHVLKDGGRALKKMEAIADVYESLQNSMSKRGLFDFDDMIMETVHALESYDDLRFTMQEKYQYVMVDEFQDTNKAQLRILQALGDNPVHEGRPNIMVVGDDDQAIYAFQGAESSNMTSFLKLYPAEVIPLVDNYRSSSEILTASKTIAEQITDRISSQLEITKELSAHAPNTAKATTSHTTFSSELAQYSWIADDIAKKISQGVLPQDIAIIAPRHRYLERLMPYIAETKVPVAYERRENILDAPLIRQLVTMARLIVAIQNNDHLGVDAYLSEVLSYDFWKLPNDLLIQTSTDIYKKHTHWLTYCVSEANPSITEITNWVVSVAHGSAVEPMEHVLDELIGPAEETEAFHSPIRRSLFTSGALETETEAYLTLLGQLSSLRQRLRQWKPDRLLLISDFVDFVALHEQAQIKIIDENPHTQTTNAVQVMTVYKAKGLEFGHVYIINAQDEIWGPTARSQHSKISLPKNLPIAPNSDGDNDKLRLLFVALTRAKHTIHITSYKQTMDNKLSPSLSYFAETESQMLHPMFVPIESPRPSTVAAVAILSTDWAYRFRQVIADKPTLFEPLLAEYKLSVTHLNNFLDITRGGPDYFFTRNLLRFPEAPSPAAAYGDAVHKTIQWAHGELRKHGSLPKDAAINEQFADTLTRKHLRPTDTKRLLQRGHKALMKYFKERGDDLLASDLIERGFNNEGVLIGEARLSGKIDKLRIKEGSAIVTDFKTGKPAVSWQGKDQNERMKLHRYRQQLLFYKLLIEGSASYQGKVAMHTGIIDFVEANEQGALATALVAEPTSAEMEEFISLIAAVWKHIMNLDFPNTNDYSQNLKGLLQFEKDLRAGTI